jgi:hypothetical protein
LVSVLFASVSGVFCPTRVSVAAGRVRTPDAIELAFKNVLLEVEPANSIEPFVKVCSPVHVCARIGIAAV